MVLEMRNITKRFPGVLALDNVSFDVKRGEVHALLGENGAGKSTLVKLLSGVYAPDGGRVQVGGEAVALASPQQAHTLGIRTLHQEPTLIPELSVAENIFLGDEPRHRWLPVIDRRQMVTQAAALLDQLGVQIAPECLVRDLTLAEQQIVEIAKLLHTEARLLILDEPTAPLSQREVDALFRLIRAIKQRGVGVLFVSHRLGELFEIADRVTVLRDGRRVVTLRVADCSADQVARIMAGRPGAALRSRPRENRRAALAAAPEVLRLEGLTAPPNFADVSFSLRRGEIVGLTGPLGSGLWALVRALSGAQPAPGGRTLIEGQAVRIDSPHRALDLGIGLLPENRQDQALLPDLPATPNISLAVLAEFGVFVDDQAEASLANHFIRRLQIKLPESPAPVRILSGGTQQKIVLARWLAAHSRIFIFEEPTRGIDINARAEIHRLLTDLAERGSAILIISADLGELVALCDRVLVMMAGRIVAALEGSAISEAALLRLLRVGPRLGDR